MRYRKRIGGQLAYDLKKLPSLRRVTSLHSGDY